MRTISREELEQILINHQHWIHEDCEGWEDMRADLRNTDLYNANLRYADLCGVDLRNAKLCGAELRNADLRNARNIPFVPLSCPDTGAFIAWKRAGAYIIKLFVPGDARRLSATGRKCRCDKVTVVAIENEDGTPAKVTEVCSDYDSSFKYSVHAHLVVEDFCEDRWKECSEGIHFFINREEAVNYK